MSRDEGDLYSGLSSRSRVRAVKAEKREVKAENRLKLLPAGEIVTAQFAKEVKALMYGPYTNEEAMTDAQFRAERRGRRLAVASLLAIQRRLEIILREPKGKPDSADVDSEVTQ